MYSEPVHQQVILNCLSWRNWIPSKVYPATCFCYCGLTGCPSIVRRWNFGIRKVWSNCEKQTKFGTWLPQHEAWLVLGVRGDFSEAACPQTWGEYSYTTIEYTKIFSNLYLATRWCNSLLKKYNSVLYKILLYRIEIRK